MAKQFYVPVNLNQYELQNARVQNLGTPPSSPVEGQIYYDSDGGDKQMYFWNGSAWRSMDATASAGGYSIIQEEGGALTARNTLNFVGGGITAADDAGNTRTNVTLDATLNALAAYNTNGLLVQTAADTFAGRSLASGDTDYISLTNADGVSGNPTINIGAQVATLDSIQTFASAKTFTASATFNGGFSVAASQTIDFNANRLQDIGTPSADTDAATKAYVDSVATGLDAKASVRVATTAAGTLATSFENGDSVDGVTLATGNRILIKDQASAQENGIYVVNASGAPTRATDLDSWAEVPGAYVWVEEGTTNGDSGWISTANAGGTLNTTAMPWTLFSSATALIAGAGLNKTGNTIDVVATGSGITVNANDIALDATLQALAGYNTNGLLTQTAADTFTGRTLTGTASRISVSNGNGVSGNPTVDIDSGYVGQASITTLGTITTGTWNATDVAVTAGGTGASDAPTARSNLSAAGYYSTATHGAGTSISILQSAHGLRASRGLVVQTQIESTGEVVEADYTVAANGDVTVGFAASQSANTIRVTIVG